MMLRTPYHQHDSYEIQTPIGLVTVRQGPAKTTTQTYKEKDGELIKSVKNIMESRDGTITITLKKLVGKDPLTNLYNLLESRVIK